MHASEIAVGALALHILSMILAGLRLSLHRGTTNQQAHMDGLPF